MIHLFAALLLILASYAATMYLTMKRTIPWRYKAFVYGALTFLMLVAVFEAFAYYETNWKVPTPPTGHVAGPQGGTA